MWFRQDLRSHDHAALSHAAGLGAVLPVYIFDPAVWQQADRSARQFGFLCESLTELRADLATLGAPLLIRSGPAREVLARLCARHAISCIVTEAAAPPELAGWARDQGLRWLEALPQTTQEPLPQPALRCPPDLVANPLPLAQMLRIAPDPCPHRQRGGRKQALDLLETFLTTRAEGYHRAQSQPLLAERASSRLSAHLTLGALGPREIASALAARLAERPAGRWPSALAQFQSQLSRRTATATTARPDLAAMPADPARQRWLEGETGLPFLDALMRYLKATGWLSHHLREVTLSLACHHLGLEWRAASLALARRLTDYDPALFWPYAVQIAGMAGHAPRIYHPTKQALTLDPTGAFTRRWLPELAQVPDSCLQTPWKWAGAARLLGRRYPEPLIDVTTAHTAAREAIWARHGKPLRALVTPHVQLIEAPLQPAKGQLRLEF